MHYHTRKFAAMHMKLQLHFQSRTYMYGGGGEN